MTSQRRMVWNMKIARWVRTTKTVVILSLQRAHSCALCSIEEGRAKIIQKIETVFRREFYLETLTE